MQQCFLLKIFLQFYYEVCELYFFIMSMVYYFLFIHSKAIYWNKYIIFTFDLMIWLIILSDFVQLNHPCLPRITTIWSFKKCVNFLLNFRAVRVSTQDGLLLFSRSLICCLLSHSRGDVFVFSLSVLYILNFSY